MYIIFNSDVTLEDLKMAEVKWIIVALRMLGVAKSSRKSWCFLFV